VNARWYDVVAEGRAVALADLGAHPRSGLAGSDGPGTAALFEFLLGLRPVLPMSEGPPARRVMALARSLNFRLAAQIYWLPTPAGPAGVNLAAVRAARGHSIRIESLRRELREMLDGSDRADNGARDPRLMPMRQVGAREWDLLAGAGPDRRERLAPRPPLLVLSSAGRPVDVAAGLHAHLGGLRYHGHRDATLVLADDANPADAADLHALSTDVSHEYGIDVTRFSEWAGDGRPGAKQLFRQQAVSLFGDRTDVRTLRRLFAPGLTGTANAVFAAYRGHDLIWLEQDAQPVALEHPGGDPYGWGVALDGDAARFEGAAYSDTQAGSGAVRRHEVDVVHIIDRLLHAPRFEASSMDEQLPSYEDTGFELFTGAATATTPAADEVGMVHFHTAGHPDFRALFNHRLLLDESTTRADRDVLRAGGLPLTRSYTGVSPSISLRRWTSAFGTVVGFSGRTAAQPLTMWDTRIRLVDFAVGQLAQARGIGACVAGTSLEHRRGDVTDSGRGELTSYLGTEELLWPLLAAAESALSRVGPKGDYQDWLTRAADSLTAASASPVVPAGLAYARWAELRHDIDVARASPRPDVRAYGDALAHGLPEPFLGHWFDAYTSLNRTAAAELLRYAAQLRTWACLSDARELRLDGTLQP
jgi:hypothetical protein